VTTADA